MRPTWIPGMAAVFAAGVACGGSSTSGGTATTAGGGTGSGAPDAGSTGGGTGPQMFHLQLTIEGAGHIVSQPAGLDCTQSCSADFASGTGVVLAATAASGYDFSGFGGACSGKSCTLTVQSDLHAYAHFELKPPPPATHRLTVALQGSGASMLSSSGLTFVTAAGSTLQCPGACSADFATGSAVALQFATGGGTFANSEFVLGGWTGCAASGASCVVAMDQDRTVTADIEFQQRVLVHVFIGGAGHGTLSADRTADQGFTNPNAAPAGEWAEFDLIVGEMVTLTPTPDANSHVGAWSAPCTTAAASPCMVKATSDMARQIDVTVRFDPNVTNAKYALQAVPLTSAFAIAGGRIAGANDKGAAVYDLATATLKQISTDATSAAYAINASGDVAGTDGGHPFVLRANGTRVDLAYNGQARAITSAGVAFGSGPGVTDGFRIGTDAVVTSIPGFQVMAANDSEKLAGCSSAGAVVGTASANSAVTPTGWHFPCFGAINAGGVAVGRTVQVQKDFAFGFSWDGALHTLGQFDVGLDGAYGINSAGDVVGTTDFGGTPTRTGFIPNDHAAILTAGTVVDLNSVSDVSGVFGAVDTGLQKAMAIDDQGRIVVRVGSQIGVLIPR